MRRQDVLGNDRPGVSNGSVKPQIALPDSIELAPIRLPRPHVVHEDPIRDIQDSRSSPHSRNRSQDDYYGTQLTPFPNHLTTRRLSSLDFSDLTPPSQAVRMRTARGMEAVPTTTDQPSVRAVTAASIPRAALRDPLARPQVADRGLRDSSPTPLTRPTQRIPTPPHSLVVGNEPVDAQSITGSIRSISQRALYRNPSLSYQRFLFSLTKFPALILVLMSLSTLWGRGEGVKLLSKEQGADIAALCTGGVILVSEVLLLHQHYNSYRKAKVMSYLYHIVMLVVFCGSLVSLVFAAVSFNDLKKIPSGQRDICKLGIARKEPWGCLSSNQRISYLSVILGCDMLIAMLALLTMGFGAVGQALMKKRRSEEYQRLTSARAYTNQAMQY